MRRSSESGGRQTLHGFALPLGVLSSGRRGGECGGGSEHPIERRAVDAELTGDSGLGDTGADESACFGDLAVGEFSRAALVLAGGLGDTNPFALAFADEGAFELGEGAEG